MIVRMVRALIHRGHGRAIMSRRRSEPRYRPGQGGENDHRRDDKAQPAQLHRKQGSISALGKQKFVPALGERNPNRR